VPELASLPPRLDHVGFVVPSIEKSVSGFLRSLGGNWDGRVFEDPYQRVKVAFLMVRPGDPRIELVEPNAADAPVNSFLANRGGGLHHVCYEVDDLEGELASSRSRGGRIAKRPHPAVAFGGRRIAWVITAEKLLVEFLESGSAQPPEQP
jgi:methylmalonyl-CoA/ethylmalonyl-CoA epimerase